jgi:hypothetical protein
MVLLLTVTVGAALVGGLIVTHIVKGTPDVTGLTVPSNIGDDVLKNNGDWPAGGTFFFANNQYHIQNKLAHNVALAFYASHQYTNFRLTVTTSELQGTQDGADYYGVAFRGNADQSRYYLFEVVAWGGGQYQFSRYDGDGHWFILAGGSAPSLLSEPGKSNTIIVQARGNTFIFWINGARIHAPITDRTKAVLATGEVGFSVEEQGTEVMFSHLYITAPA